MANALTIDVEEHFQVHAFESLIRRSDWDREPSRVAASTRRVLALLAERGVRATFFVLGWVADRQPRLVREIADSGHEIATHGYWHELVYRQTPAEFRADLLASVEAIERATGVRPVGYRAPSFSITRESWWALDVLRDAGFAYDASIFPVGIHDRYGVADAPRFAHRHSNGLLELPASTVRVGGRNLPVAGGGYLRLYPLWLTQRAMRRIQGEGHPVMTYMHPWEFDPEQPRVPDAPLRSRLRHYANLDKTADRLRALLAAFEFAPISQVFAAELAAR
jgi:polysaccharide deacetylase family protein (PEP-CTERM system associated)